MANFIPAFHFEKPSSKLTKEWAMKAVNYYINNTANRNLLHGKNLKDIEGYATGDFDMTPFIKIFKSLRKQLTKEKAMQAAGMLNGDSKVGMEFTPLPLLPEKINSAISILSKIPVEVSCNASDPTAIEKKQRDINFIKNKPLIEAEIQDLYDRAGLDEVDLGTTENSSVPYSDSPFGLDLNEPDELDIFVNLIYALKIEAAFEIFLQAYYDLKNVKAIRLLEIKDQYWYGVSCHRSLQSPITGLPDIEYEHPGNIEVPDSQLKDFSDNTHRIINKVVTPLELFGLFGDEIKNQAHLEEIVLGKETGYCDCNKLTGVNKGNFDTFKMTLKYIEVRSVDWIGVAKSKHKKGYTTLTEDESKVDEKIWAQNTYGFWWLVNTDHVYGIHRLGEAHRSKGKESIQNFSTHIYKSQPKSAVELSIGENKKAQIADIKLQYQVLKALPPGRYIDLRYLRGAMSGLKDDVSSETMENLITLALQDNIVMGDTEDFDGKNDGQFKPVMDLPGGLGNIAGYASIIFQANQTISQITGINAQLTGQSANPEGLVGMQKLLINSSINALDYSKEAITDQYQKLFTSWANILKQVVEEGGEPRKAVEAIIGERNVYVVDGLNDMRLHDIGVRVKIGQREEERAEFVRDMEKLDAKGVLTVADKFMAREIDNPKAKVAFLAVKEKKWLRKQDEIRQQQFEQQSALVQQAGQNQLAVSQAKTEGKLQEVAAKGEAQARVLKLAAELGLTSQQFQAVADAKLQHERNKAQRDKNIEVMEKGAELEQQKSLV